VFFINFGDHLWGASDPVGPLAGHAMLCNTEGSHATDRECVPRAKEEHAVALKLAGMRNQAIGLLLAAIILIGYDIVAIIHLIMAGDWSSVDTAGGVQVIGLGSMYLLTMLITTVILVLAAVASLKQWRLLSQEIGQRHLPEATHQPDPGFALRAGETLFLERNRASGGVRTMFAWFMMILCLVGLCVSCITSILPTFTYAAFNPLAHYLINTSGTPPPDLLDWYTMLFSVVLGAVLFIEGMIDETANFRQRITADDRGITLAIWGRKARFIPWHDILLVVWNTKNDDSVEGAYTLVGRDHALTFTIASPSTSTDLGKQPGKSFRYTYTGGYEAYTQDVRRLLATIAVRAMTPIRTTRLFPPTQHKQRRFLWWRLTRAQAMAAPSALPPWQPVTASPPAGMLVELRQRVPYKAIAIESIFWLIALAVAFILFEKTQAPSYPGIIAPPPDLSSILFVFGIAAIIVTPGAIFVAASRRMLSITRVKADDAGIMVATGNNGAAVVVAWAEVRAWGVIPPPPGTRRAARYIIFTDSYLRLMWQEPTEAMLAGRGVPGDRRAAYRQRAEELHALIVAKSGQPLRDLAAMPPASD
jgi:hypothetical protein